MIVGWIIGIAICIFIVLIIIGNYIRWTEKRDARRHLAEQYRQQKRR